MQFLWIGCLESDEEFEIKAKKGYDLASAQVSQKNILLGLENVSGTIFDSINGSVLPPYPVYQDRDIPTVEWSHKMDSYDISVGYRNDKYINRINCKNAMLKAADIWINDRYKNDGLVVFVYSMRSAPMATACYIKRRITEARIYLIVTDLPQFMDLGQSKLKAILKQIDWRNIKRMQSKFDGFILYASKMAEFLKIPDNKWMLMEGSYDLSENTVEEFNDLQEKANVTRKKAIMYSGKLDKEYGIPMLLDAFMKIEDTEAELWLTGGGNAEEYIRASAAKDSRIKFYGFMPSRKDVLDLQKKATVLINMRLPSEEASDYCFPSKIFEYMVTGIPVLSFKLGGIPVDYYKYLITIENESIAAIQKAIMDTMEMSDEERKCLGLQARKFILENKTAMKQCEKIMNFVKNK